METTIDRLAQLLQAPLPQQDEYDIDLPAHHVQLVHRLLHQTPMPRLMSLLALPLLQTPSFQKQAESYLDACQGDMTMKQKSMEVEINSTCPEQEFPSCLGLSLSADHSSWQSIQSSLNDFDQLSNWSRDDLGVFFKVSCTDSEAANQVQQELGPMLEGLGEMIKGNLYEGIKDSLPFPPMDNSPLKELFQGIEDTLKIGVDCNGNDLVFYAWVDWADLRDLFSFLRNKASALSGQDSQLHFMAQLKSMFSLKDLVEHLQDLKQFLLQNASNPRTNLSMSLQAKLSMALMQMLRDHSKNKQSLAEMTLHSKVRMASHLFLQGLNRIKLSFQYGKDAVEYSEGIEHLHNKLKKSKSLELMSQSGDMVSMYASMVEQSGMQDTVDSLMSSLVGNAKVVISLGLIHLCVDCHTAGLADIYHKARAMQ